MKTIFEFPKLYKDIIVIVIILVYVSEAIKSIKKIRITKW